MDGLPGECEVCSAPSVRHVVKQCPQLLMQTFGSAKLEARPTRSLPLGVEVPDGAPCSVVSLRSLVHRSRRE